MKILARVKNLWTGWTNPRWTETKAEKPPPPKPADWNPKKEETK